MSKKSNDFLSRWITGIFLLFSFNSSHAASNCCLNQTNVIIFSDHIRLVATTNQTVDFKQFMIENPARLVVDLSHTQLAKTFSEAAQKNIKNRYIDNIHVGQFNPNTVRIVITLKTKINAKITQALATSGTLGNQLNIDIYPANKIIEKPIQKTIEPPITIPVKSNQSHYQQFVVMIDPGHGGHDSGAIGFSRTKEKDVVLTIAKELQKLLILDPRIKVYLTREDDIFIPLGTRVIKARQQHADLFISIHADAYTKQHAHGSSVFALSEKGATSTAAAMLAKSQNSVDQIIGVSTNSANIYVRHTLLDLTQTATINSSLKLGKYVLENLEKINTLHQYHVEQAGFAVLKAPDIPSILVETAFISNPEEEEKLNSNDFQRKIAKAIVNGIQAYMATLYRYYQN